MARPLSPKRRAKREASRARKLVLATEAAITEAARRETAAEQISPRAQREPVPGLRGPRVVQDGLTFRRSSPLHHLHTRGSVTSLHLKAAKRLHDAWSIAGEGIGTGASNYTERTSHSGIGSNRQDGMILMQIEKRDDLIRCEAALGPLWPAIHAVVLRGLDVTAWAATIPMRREVALGYLLAALDQLARHYWPHAVVPLYEIKPTEAAAVQEA